MARNGSQREERTRGVLEIVTAILLGLVSVATAIGAYQAGQWGQESDDLASVSQQLRDRNLALFLESQNTSRDDGERMFDALALYAEYSFYPERTESLMLEQDVIMAAASKPLADSFGAWRDAGYPIDQAPLLSPDYEAQTFAPPQSYNVASVIAYRASEVLEERSYRMTIVSVVFALALLLLGVAGVSTRLDVSALLTGGGALAFLIGVAIVTFGIF
ncbi:MAG: hypothetical protein ABUL47_03780 [Leifsonia sp.]